jgi:hypothetical protein
MFQVEKDHVRSERRKSYHCKQTLYYDIRQHETRYIRKKMQAKGKGEGDVNRREVDSKGETKRTNRWRGDRMMENEGEGKG